MKELKKFEAAKDNGSSCCSFGLLPDEIVFEILSKVIDLKSLCICKLVSKRFNRVVLQVETISYHAVSSMESRSLYLSPITSLKEFIRVRSLCIQLLPIGDYNRCSFFKWKIKFGNKVDSFLFISPIYTNENFHELYILNKVPLKKYDIAMQCLTEVTEVHRMMLGLINDLPLLEKVYITDSGKRGTISVTGEKIAQLRENGETIYSRERVSKCLPNIWTNFPVPGIVTKGVTVILFCRRQRHKDNDSIIKFDEDDIDDDDFEDACTEVVKKFLKRISVKSRSFLDV